MSKNKYQLPHPEIVQFDLDSANRAALTCLEAIEQLAKVVEYHVNGAVITTTAQLRHLYEFEIGFRNPFHHHYEVTSLAGRSLACARALKLIRDLRSDMRDVVFEYKNDPRSPSDGWQCLWDAFKQFLDCQIGPTRTDLAIIVEKVDADEYGVQSDQQASIPPHLCDPPWHPKAWPFVCACVQDWAERGLLDEVEDLYRQISDDLNASGPDSPHASQFTVPKKDLESGSQTGQTRSEPGSDISIPETHVTLLQMAASVNKSKRTLEKLRDKGELPPPAVKGGKGRADEWRWSSVKPILEKIFTRPLPEKFPAERFLRR